MKRRTAIAQTIGALVLVLSTPHHAQAWPWERNDGVAVTLTVEDEAGRPIPYASVWGMFGPRLKPESMNIAKMWAAAQQYQSSFDLVQGFYYPVYMLVSMASETGISTTTVSYSHQEGAGSKRPPEMRLGFAVMQRGFVPQLVEFSIANQKEVSAKVVLKRNPEIDQESISAPYWREFDKLRYEVSDDALSERMDRQNQRRLDSVYADMARVAQQALDAGDKRAAARIYSRMRTLPFLIVIDGRIAGYSHGESWNPDGLVLMRKAYALDPTNPYMAAENQKRVCDAAYRLAMADYRAGREPDWSAFRKAMADFKRLLDEHGSEIWPDAFREYQIYRNKETPSLQPGASH